MFQACQICEPRCHASKVRWTKNWHRARLLRVVCDTHTRARRIWYVTIRLWKNISPHAQFINRKTVGLSRYKFLMFLRLCISTTGQTNERDPTRDLDTKQGENSQAQQPFNKQGDSANYDIKYKNAHDGRKFGLDGFAVIDHILTVHPTTSKLRQKVTSQTFSQVSLWPRCRYARSTGVRTYEKMWKEQIERWHDMTWLILTCIHFAVNKLFMFKKRQKAVKAKPLQRCTTPQNV